MLTERTENSTNGFERHFDQMLLFMEPSLSTSRLDCCILFHHLHTWSQWQHLLQLFFQLITYLVFPTSSNSSVHITLSCPVKVKVKSLSCVQLFVTLWTVARQAPLSMGILQVRILEWVAMPSSSLSWFKCNPNLFLSQALSSSIFPAELPFLAFSSTIPDAVNPAGG